MSRKLTSKEAAGGTLGHLDYTPLTFWQKIGEYVEDHWKMLLILFIAVIGIIVAFIQLNKQPAPDIKVMFISSSYVLPKDTTKKLEELLTPYVEDVNKDTAQYAKVYACYHGDRTGTYADAAALTDQLLADDSCYIIFADPDAYAWLVENGYVSKLSEFDTNRSDIEPDALGFLLSDSNIFGYVNNGLLGFAGDDYGLSNAFSDYHIVFKTGAYDELTGNSLNEFRASIDFYQGVMSTIVTITSSVSSASE